MALSRGEKIIAGGITGLFGFFAWKAYENSQQQQAALYEIRQQLSAAGIGIPDVNATATAEAAFINAQATIEAITGRRPEIIGPKEDQFTANPDLVVKVVTATPEESGVRVVTATPEPVRSGGKVEDHWLFFGGDPNLKITIPRRDLESVHGALRKGEDAVLIIDTHLSCPDEGCVEHQEQRVTIATSLENVLNNSENEEDLRIGPMDGALGVIVVTGDKDKIADFLPKLAIEKLVRDDLQRRERNEGNGDIYCNNIPDEFANVLPRAVIASDPVVIDLTDLVSELPDAGECR